MKIETHINRCMRRSHRTNAFAWIACYNIAAAPPLYVKMKHGRTTKICHFLWNYFTRFVFFFLYMYSIRHLEMKFSFRHISIHCWILKSVKLITRNYCTNILASDSHSSITIGHKGRSRRVMSGFTLHWTQRDIWDALFYLESSPHLIKIKFGNKMVISNLQKR